ncbi:hypothetical protein [Methanonatronarchaeum sp. AMET-Sl]|uniref:hypothetical protein n=1 Tax=Methanonatronarchaeum sp. AMET-Sl TaxID=3037654 RepID=UPI00244DFAB0|nr:hypothetical protein [Methanonatronarchaeum sp. AMET-Sl]WGI17972.1 hypothetical protein QEN48_02915 [Methanonatronarchaeum sp. AMET-Sl]
MRVAGIIRLPDRDPENHQVDVIQDRYGEADLELYIEFEQPGFTETAYDQLKEDICDFDVIAVPRIENILWSPKKLKDLIRLSNKHHTRIEIIDESSSGDDDRVKQEYILCSIALFIQKERKNKLTVNIIKNWIEDSATTRKQENLK